MCRNPEPSLVLGPWCLVLGPSVVLGPSLVLGPWSLVRGPWSVRQALLGGEGEPNPYAGQADAEFPDRARRLREASEVSPLSALASPGDDGRRAQGTVG